MWVAGTHIDVLTFTRYHQSVATGQAPITAVERKIISAGKQIKTEDNTRVYTQ